MDPTLIKGGVHKDWRGILRFNNAFDAIEVKRIYIIENADVEIVRGWQGHKVERRWFTVVQGRFEIKLIQIDHWEKPSKDLHSLSFQLTDENLEVLAVPAGYVSSIQALEPNAKLLAMSDYALGEIQDVYRYNIDYFSLPTEG